MADTIKCPVCGEENPVNQNICQNCQTPLSPFGDSSIKPGQVPTKKHTSELEPILPQWLKDARDAAQSTGSYPDAVSKQEQPSSPPPASSEDLLAGLQSQTGDEDEDEVPDWLANITGSAPKPHKTTEEPSEVRWVEMGGKDDFPQEEPAGDDANLPPWLSNLQSPASQPQIDELTNFPQDASAQVEPVASFDETVPDLSTDDTPDWLRQMAADMETKSEDVLAQTPNDAPELQIDTPDWLHSLRGAEEQTQGAEPAPVSESDSGGSDAFDLSSLDIPDWMKGSSENEAPAQDTTPAWLKEEAADSQSPEIPAWLAGEETPHMAAEPAQDETPAQEDFSGDLPSWLKAAAPEVSIFDEPAAEETTSESPDWLGTFQPEEASKLEEATGEPEAETNAPFDSVPAFVPEAQPEEALGDLFTEMPDWLSNSLEPSPPTADQPASDGEIKPGELPSWVQAMRPLESEPATPSLSSDQTLESHGALAGLHGVLPAMPGFAPTSKPKAHSIKLNASNEQLAHAEILEQILAAETAPVPLETMSNLGTSRALRWLLATVILLAIILPLSLRTRIFAMPQGVPNETRSAVLVMQSIPADARLLVAVDYEPSRAAEMEAAAAPFFDNLLTLKPPRLTLVATNETGALLAERFISGPLAGHNLQSGVNYLNLGYLSGGQMGIRAFAQNPSVTAPLDIELQPAWDSTPLDGISTFGEFTAMILLTDNADAARVWIEQTESLRAGTPFIVIASAQAAPMIQPYYESGQVNGVISGLYGGAIFEAYNAGRPGTARSYWDAYSLGMLLAMSLALGGGLWNFALGMRERAETREAK